MEAVPLIFVFFATKLIKFSLFYLIRSDEVIKPKEQGPKVLDLWPLFSWVYSITLSPLL